MVLEDRDMTLIVRRARLGGASGGGEHRGAHAKKISIHAEE
jgi:hypothetical protein